ncbi:hypothetical protein JNW88_00360 [Micromonospora sp. ATA32]|nr:hypothetical protein [Micromonospora sp. ATA32]
MIVTVTPTIGDGTVVRWYHDSAPLDALSHIATVSASRNGVLISGYLHEVPDDVMAAAKEVWQQLQRDHNADVQHLATHRKRRMFGPYEPITEAQETRG